MEEKTFEESLQLLEKWEEKRRSHPFLKDSFYFLRSFIKGKKMEIAFSSLRKRTKTFLFSLYIASIGSKKEESIFGWKGGEISKLEEKAYMLMCENLKPLSFGEKALLKANLQLITSLLAWFYFEEVKPSSRWKQVFSSIHQKEMQETVSFFSFLFMSGSKIAKSYFSSLFKVLGKEEKIQKKAETLSFLYVSFLSLLFIKTKEPKAFEMSFEALSSRLSFELKQIKDSLSYEEEAKKISSFLETFYLILEKQDLKGFENELSNLFTSIHIDEKLFVKELNDLSQTTNNLNEYLQHAFSQKQMISTGIIQSA